MWSDPSPKRRWPRSQRFALSPKGVDAERAYREAVVASRAQEGRGSFEATCASWAEAFHLKADDGAYLGELRDAGQTLNELVKALEACGKSRSDVLQALERLEDAGLLSTGAEGAKDGPP